MYKLLVDVSERRNQRIQPEIMKETFQILIGMGVLGDFRFRFVLLKAVDLELSLKKIVIFVTKTTNFIYFKSKCN